MVILFLVLLAAVFVAGIYFVIQSKKRINELEIELRRLNQRFTELDQAPNGKVYDGETTKFGSLKGKVDYLDGRVDALIEVLNDKFINLGKRLDVHEMQFGPSLDSEVIERHLKK